MHNHSKVKRLAKEATNRFGTQSLLNQLIMDEVPIEPTVVSLTAKRHLDENLPSILANEENKCTNNKARRSKKSNESLETIYKKIESSQNLTSMANLKYKMNKLKISNQESSRSLSLV